jgi:hypothetical protein
MVRCDDWNGKAWVLLEIALFTDFFVIPLCPGGSFSPSKGVKIARSLNITGYKNREFGFEDIDGCWIGVGIKER